MGLLNKVEKVTSQNLSGALLEGVGKLHIPEGYIKVLPYCPLKEYGV